MTDEKPYDIWVELNDIHPAGTVTTYPDMARDGVDLEPGAELVAGDGEGNRCPATVVRRRWRRRQPNQIVLRLDLERFEAAP